VVTAKFSHILVSEPFNQKLVDQPSWSQNNVIMPRRTKGTS